MYRYDTVTEAINDLRSRGFVIDFNIVFDKLHCIDDGLCLNPSEFEITEVHRFESDSNPSDEAVVYAVKSKSGNVKGIITASFGIYSDDISDEMMRKLGYNRDKK